MATKLKTAKQELDELLTNLDNAGHEALQDIIDVIPCSVKAFSKIAANLQQSTRETYAEQIKALTKLNALLDLDNGNANGNGKSTTLSQPKQNQKEDKDTRRIIYLPFYKTDGKCFEAVQINGADAWMYYNGTKFEVSDEIGTQSVRYLPNQNTHTKFVITTEELAYPLPATKELYEDLQMLVDDFFAHPDQRVAKFMALYLLSSYIITKAPGTIFVWLVGQKRAGKTTLQLIAEQTAYRPFGGVEASESAIFRTLGHEVEYGPLVLLREFESASDVMRSITREGDIPGATIPRVDKEGERWVVNHYKLFGTRLVASNSLHGNDADMDRYIIIKCVNRKPRHERAQLYTDPVMINWLQKLRSRLLRWKVANYAKIRFPLVDPKAQFTGRDWEHFAAVISLAAEINEELEHEVRAYIAEYLTDQTEGVTTSTSVVREAILELAKTGSYNYGDGFRIPAAAIWEQVIAQTEPYYNQDGTTSSYKRLLPDGSTISTTKVGKIIKEHLGGKSSRLWRNEQNDIVRGYIWLKGEFDTYITGSDDNSTPVTSVTSVTGLGQVDSQKTPRFEPLLAKRSPNQRLFLGGSQPEPVTPVTPVTTQNSKQNDSNSNTKADDKTANTEHPEQPEQGSANLSQTSLDEVFISLFDELAKQNDSGDVERQVLADQMVKSGKWPSLLEARKFVNKMHVEGRIRQVRYEVYRRAW